MLLCATAAWSKYRIEGQEQTAGTLGNATTVETLALSVSCQPRCFSTKSQNPIQIRGWVFEYANDRSSNFRPHRRKSQRKITICVMPHALIGARRSRAVCCRLHQASSAFSFSYCDGCVKDRRSSCFAHLMRSISSPHQRQDNLVRIEHQVVGYYVVGGGSAEAVMSPDRGRVIDHGCALRWSWRSI